MKPTALLTNRLFEKLAAFIKSNKAFYLVIILFIIGASWIAVSSVYPMAFDEEVHLGIIRFFTSHPNPFFGQQPAELDQFGAVARDASYLYRYAMTVPWHFITWLTDNFMAQVVFMRLVNVSLFSAGLVVFRNLIIVASKSKILANLSLILVALTPVSSQLAGQINYDNLFFLLLGLMLLFAVKILDSLNSGKADVLNIGLLIIIGLAGSLVKYTFLPIFAAVAAYIVWSLFIAYKTKKPPLGEAIVKQTKKLGKTRIIILSALVVLSSGLFLERYGLNLIRYQTPNPGCVAVIGTDRCQSYSIYRRSIIYRQNKPEEYSKSPLLFTYRWLKHMQYNLMSTLNGPTSGYAIGQPLPLPFTAAITFAIGGLVLTAVFWRRLIKRVYLRLMGFAVLVYLALLWGLNYSAYLQTGRRVAVQGRYLVPLLPLIYFVFLKAYAYALKGLPNLRAGLAVVLVICFASGGALTFVLHSDSAWYWPNNFVISTNQKVQKVLAPVIPGSSYELHYRTSFEW